jgi:hypothetical protein
MNTEAFEALAKELESPMPHRRRYQIAESIRDLIAHMDAAQVEEYRHWCQKGHERIGLMDYSGEGDDDCPLCIANRRIAELSPAGDVLREALVGLLQSLEPLSGCTAYVQVAKAIDVARAALAAVKGGDTP